MMKPKGASEHETGLLEYLEDIIGTDRYIPQLEEAAKTCGTGGGGRPGAAWVLPGAAWAPPAAWPDVAVLLLLLAGC